MALREIVYSDNPILRRKAQRVGRITRATQTLIDDMIETMRAASGVGLAAPQVGISERIIVVEPPPDDDDEYAEDGAAPEGAPAAAAPPAAPEGARVLYVVVNPEIVKVSTELEEGAEGCLSIPHFYGLVDRHYAITVKGFDRHGQPVRYKLNGWTARIFQHEVDHLNGILFIDHIKDPQKIWRVNERGERVVPAGPAAASAAPRTAIPGEPGV